MESKYLYTIWALKLHEPPNFLELKTSKDGEHKCHWNLTIGEIRVQRAWSWTAACQEFGNLSLGERDQCGNREGKARFFSVKNHANRDSKFLL